jgi:hypothetical protein
MKALISTVTPPFLLYAALHLQEEIAKYATEVKREHGVGFSARTG